MSDERFMKEVNACLYEIQTSLNPFIGQTAEGKSLRKIAWNSISTAKDGDEKDLVSLDELVVWLESILSEQCVELYADSFELAFEQAKDLLTSTEKEGKLQKKLFRMYIAHVVLCAEMLSLYVTMNGTHASDRLTRDQFCAAYDGLAKDSDFVMFQDKQSQARSDLFEEENEVTYRSFCSFVLEKEQQAKTDRGKLMAHLTSKKHLTGSVVATAPKKRIWTKPLTPPKRRPAVTPPKPPSYAHRKTPRHHKPAAIPNKQTYPSEAFKKFHRIFQKFSEPSTTAKSRQEKNTAWGQCNANANPYVSLAEFDAWLRFKCDEKHKAHGKQLWSLFRPCYILAFNRAKSIAPPSDNADEKQAQMQHDYVTKREFRLLNLYLILYAEMLDAFHAIDTTTITTVSPSDIASHHVHHDDHDQPDKRIAMQEWKENSHKVLSYGYVVFSKLSKETTDFQAQVIFKKMDSDGKGMVLLNEWCDYIVHGEISHKTVKGKLLQPPSVANQKKDKKTKTPRKQQQQLQRQSSSKQSKSSTKQHLAQYLTIFTPLTSPSSISRTLRNKIWSSTLDLNNNNLVSLAEVDSWIKTTCIAKFKATLGTTLWKKFRPTFILAFDAAKSVAPTSEEQQQQQQKIDKDDYVTKKEFRLLNVYLCIFAQMMDIFDIVDASASAFSDSKDEQGEKDRRITKEEWNIYCTSKKHVTHDFKALSTLTSPPPQHSSSSTTTEQIFQQMDADGKGMVLLKEWCMYLAKYEIEADTTRGAELNKSPYVKDLVNDVVLVAGATPATTMTEREAPIAEPEPEEPALVEDEEKEKEEVGKETAVDDIEPEAVVEEQQQQQQQEIKDDILEETTLDVDEVTEEKQGEEVEEKSTPLDTDEGGDIKKEEEQIDDIESEAVMEEQEKVQEEEEEVTSQDEEGKGEVEVQAVAIEQDGEAAEVETQEESVQKEVEKDENFGDEAGEIDETEKDIVDDRAEKEIEMKVADVAAGDDEKDDKKDAMQEDEAIEEMNQQEEVEIKEAEEVESDKPCIDDQGEKGVVTQEEAASTAGEEMESDVADDGIEKEMDRQEVPDVNEGEEIKTDKAFPDDQGENEIETQENIDAVEDTVGKEPDGEVVEAEKAEETLVEEAEETLVEEAEETLDATEETLPAMGETLIVTEETKEGNDTGCVMELAVGKEDDIDEKDITENTEQPLSDAVEEVEKADETFVEETGEKVDVTEEALVSTREAKEGNDTGCVMDVDVGKEDDIDQKDITENTEQPLLDAAEEVEKAEEILDATEETLPAMGETLIATEETKEGNDTGCVMEVTGGKEYGIDEKNITESTEQPLSDAAEEVEKAGETLVEETGEALDVTEEALVATGEAKEGNDTGCAMDVAIGKEDGTDENGINDLETEKQDAKETNEASGSESSPKKKRKKKKKKGKK